MFSQWGKSCRLFDSQLADLAELRDTTQSLSRVFLPLPRFNNIFFPFHFPKFTVAPFLRHIRESSDSTRTTTAAGACNDGSGSKRIFLFRVLVSITGRMDEYLESRSSGIPSRRSRETQGNARNFASRVVFFRLCPSKGLTTLALRL